MSPQPSQPPSSPIPADQHAEDALLYRAALHKLIDVGNVVVEDLRQQATRPRPAIHPAPDFTIPFERIARAIRLTIMLARKVAEPYRPPPAAAQPDTLAARKHIIRAVEDSIQRNVKGDRAETLQAELQERLDTPDLETDINSRPINEIITDICRDLNVHDHFGPVRFKRRTPEDIQTLNASAARHRSPAGRPPPPGQPPNIRPRPPNPGQPPPRTQPCQADLAQVHQLLSQIP